MTNAAKHHASHPPRSDSDVAAADLAASLPRELHASAALAALAPGLLVAGKYRLTREIGHGGMGAVWEARHETLERPVAVKFLKPWTNADEARAERFVSEAQMVAALEHRFIVDVFDFGVSDEGLYFMVLELLKGSSLAHRLEHGPALRVHAAIGVIADCLRGLHAVHEAGIVHRDLKPDNIILVEDADGMFPKLIDFGISKRTESGLTATTPGAADGEPRKRSRLTAPGMVIGTLDYMPPEQLRGRDDLDRRADVYSMGVILFEWLAGRVPFDQDNIADLIVAITLTGAPSLARVRLDLGPEIAAVLSKALACRAEDRYPTALALREALLETLASIGPDAMTGRLPTVPLPAAARYSNHGAAPAGAVAQPPAAAPAPSEPQPPAAQPAAIAPQSDPGELQPSAASVDPHPQPGAAPAATSRARAGFVVLALLLTFGLGVYAVHRASAPPPISVLKPRTDLSPPPQAEPAATLPTAPAPLQPEAGTPRGRRADPKIAAPNPRVRPAQPRSAKPAAEPAPTTPRQRKMYKELDF